MKTAINYLILALLLALCNQVIAFDGYVEITPSQPTQTGDNIEVLEIFWYGCRHCYDFEPFINKWLEKMILLNPSQWIWSHDRWK